MPTPPTTKRSSCSFLSPWNQVEETGRPEVQTKHHLAPHVKVSTHLSCPFNDKGGAMSLLKTHVAAFVSGFRFSPQKGTTQV